MYVRYTGSVRVSSTIAPAYAAIGSDVPARAPRHRREHRRDAPDVGVEGRRSTRRFDDNATA